jgi:hypothetical protein
MGSEFTSPEIRTEVEALSRACEAWRAVGNSGPVCCVVLTDGALDQPAVRLTEFFISCGFVIVQVNGQRTVDAVVDAVRVAGATVAVLSHCTPERYALLRPLAVSVGRSVEVLLGVGRFSEEREGDRTAPYLVEGNESPERLLRLASFILRRIGIVDT